MPNDKQELDDDHRARTLRLLAETNRTCDAIGYHRDFLLAYQAVLTKDLLFVMNELLIYKQQEVHQ